MDTTTQYCPIRKDLEKRSWKLVSKLSSLSPRLMVSAGIDHKVFNETTAELRETRAEIVEIRQQLEAHRSKHGC